MIKLKRIFILLLTLVCLGTTAYAATVTDLVVANQKEFLGSALIVKKTMKYNYATVNITAGPSRARDTVYVYVGESTGSATYRTKTASFDSATSKNLLYNPFDYDDFCDRNYKLYAQIVPYSYSSTLTIKGSFVP